MKFSQRIGITPAQKEIQLESIDDDLKNSLWNICVILLKAFSPGDRYISSDSIYINEYEQKFANSLWHDFFKWNIENVPHDRDELKVILRKWFFKAKWFEIYDLIQFSFDYISVSWHDTAFIEEGFNNVLERDFSGYRFIQGQLVRITNEQEISTLNEALGQTGAFTALKGCNIHLWAALQKISDRINPDYRNSIKESISAVESLVNSINGTDSDSLGKALKKTGNTIPIHASLLKGFELLYGYTSDTGGIRHFLLTESNCDFEDAKYMLVSCSAFINYLISKANRAGIGIQ